MRNSDRMFLVGIALLCMQINSVWAENGGSGAPAAPGAVPAAPAPANAGTQTAPASPAKPASKTSNSKGKAGRDKEADGSEARDRFQADTVIKSKYEFHGEPLEVDPD